MECYACNKAFSRANPADTYYNGDWLCKLCMNRIGKLPRELSTLERSERVERWAMVCTMYESEGDLSDYALSQ